MCAVAMCVFLAIGRLMMPDIKHHHIILLEGKARGGMWGGKQTSVKPIALSCYPSYSSIDLSSSFGVIRLGLVDLTNTRGCD